MQNLLGLTENEMNALSFDENNEEVTLDQRILVDKFSKERNVYMGLRRGLLRF